VIHSVNGNASVLFENLLVLAIDTETGRPEDKAGVPGVTATLQLDNTEQVLKLAAAKDRGNLNLVLRPGGDDAFNTNRKDFVVPPPPPPPPPILEEK
jgi:Flp pilus assembly protein CpaB